MGVLEVKKLIGEGFMTPTRVRHVFLSQNTKIGQDTPEICYFPKDRFFLGHPVVIGPGPGPELDNIFYC